MSEQQTRRGKFKEIDLKGKTIEEYCEEYCTSRDKVKLYGETWREYFFDMYWDKFFVVNDRLFQIIAVEKLDSVKYTQIDKEDNGVYSFYSTFYDGGTCLTECLEDKLEKML